MADAEDLRGKLGGIVRTSAGNQAKAYRDYGTLLERLSAREIKPVEFARDAIDLYMGALGKIASEGVTLASEALTAALKGLDSLASATAEAARDIEKEHARNTAPTITKAPSRKVGPASPTT
jgi:hypothetical protein